MARKRTSPFIIFLSPAEQAQLEHWQQSTTIQAGLAKRARIMLLRARGLALSEIGQRLAVERRIVRKWLKRFPSACGRVVRSVWPRPPASVFPR